MNPLDTIYWLSGPALFALGTGFALCVFLAIAYERRQQRRRAAAGSAVCSSHAVPIASRVVPFADLPLDEAFYLALVPAISRATPPAQQPTATTDGTVYRISSATLAAAYRYLTQRLPDQANAEPEWLLAISGLKLPTGERTLETLIEIQLRAQDPVRAAFDMRAFTAAAVTLTTHGQALHAIFHSHRFAGPPSPSGVDLALQRQLDVAYPAIQAIFSEDGYVRFFGGAQPWQVTVHGRGVERIAADLYRITERAVLPTPAVRP